MSVKLKSVWENSGGLMIERILRDNSGIATISSSDTYVDIVHGLESVPVWVVPIPTDENGLDCFISNIGSTTFRINIQVPQLSNSVFLWAAGL